MYGSVNWISSLRPDVGQFYFAWEKQIPYVPAMIIPYMSIDLFFIAAAFVCRTRAELHTFVARTLFAIGISAIFFLLLPLHFSFDRPSATSWLARAAELFKTFDRPYNLAPSLHISLRTILLAVYLPQLRGIARKVLLAWFALIGLSTLLVYQHHFVDVVAGDAVALCCFYLFPERSPAIKQASLARNLGVGRLYGLGSIALLVLVLPGGLLLALVWPAVSLAIIACAYFAGNPDAFQKREGTLSVAAQILLAPYLAGAWISFRWFSRRPPSHTRITDRVFVGRKLSRIEARKLPAAGFVAVVDLTAEFSETRALRQLEYLSLPTLDLTAPSLVDLDRAVGFVQHWAARGKVYVHCALGYGRAATVAAAYLRAEGIAESVDSAVAMLKGVRPGVVIKPEMLEVLHAYERSLVSSAANIAGSI